MPPFTADVRSDSRRLGSRLRRCYSLLNVLDGAAQLIRLLLKSGPIQMPGCVRLRRQLIEIIADCVKLSHHRIIIRRRQRLRYIPIDERPDVRFPRKTCLFHFIH